MELATKISFLFFTLFSLSFAKFPKEENIIWKETFIEVDQDDVILHFIDLINKEKQEIVYGVNKLHYVHSFVNKGDNTIKFSKEIISNRNEMNFQIKEDDKKYYLSFCFFLGKIDDIETIGKEKIYVGNIQNVSSNIKLKEEKFLCFSEQKDYAYPKKGKIDLSELCSFYTNFYLPKSLKGTLELTNKLCSVILQKEEKIVLPIVSYRKGDLYFFSFQKNYFYDDGMDVIMDSGMNCLGNNVLLKKSVEPGIYLAKIVIEESLEFPFKISSKSEIKINDSTLFPSDLFSFKI